MYPHVNILSISYACLDANLRYTMPVHNLYMSRIIACASCATAIDAVRMEKGKEGKETVRTYDS